MNMKEFSAITTLSSHTLRYYEKIALIKNIQRNPNGHRVYINKDVEWVKFIIRLKETGMPLEDMLEYARLRELGASTLSIRKKLLEAHRIKLKAYIESQLHHLDALEQKITLYKSHKIV